jgi:CheY-like chemotaxis protein
MADRRRTNASAPVTQMDSINAVELTPAVDHPIAHSTSPTGSVLICDDRPAAGCELSQTFRQFLPSIAPVDAEVVADGFALVDAFEATQADLVLIGIHAATSTGIEAINLLLGIHPQARTVVYGSVIDVELLAAAYAQGAGGLLVWAPTAGEPQTQRPGHSHLGCAGANPRPARSRRD